MVGSNERKMGKTAKLQYSQKSLTLYLLEDFVS